MICKMSMQQAHPHAPNMTETSVIKHYKKRLIYRQHDDLTTTTSKLSNEVNSRKIFESEKNTIKNNIKDDTKKVRKKRKNKNCRRQFRHEGMELIKLGSNSSHSLCKTRESYNVARSAERPIQATAPFRPSVLQSVIQSAKRPPLEPLPCKIAPYVPTLSQIVPDPPRVPVIYRSPPISEYQQYFLQRTSYPPLPEPLPMPIPHVNPVSRSTPIRPIPMNLAIRQPTQTDSNLRKRKVEEQIVAAIDLTVDSNDATKKHQCYCECSKKFKEFPDNTYRRGLLKLDDNRKEVPKTPTVVDKEKLPPLFRIDDLLKKGVKIDSKSTNLGRKDHSVRSIIGERREQSLPITISDRRGQSMPSLDNTDTVSISSNSSIESIRSPSLEKQIPHGKLFFYKSNNSFIRYFDDAQKKLFIDNITSNSDRKYDDDKEMIKLPQNAIFSNKDSLTVEEYVSEMTLVEKYIPKDFFLFYKFVTGYQICNNNHPVSFLTFLKIYNTNGLKILLERYIKSLK